MWETDEAMIIGMKQHSNQAFKAFYERYIDYVYKIVFSIVKDHGHSLDLCQELFLEFYQKAHTYSPERGSVKAWVAVKARSRSLDFVRKNAKVIDVVQVEKQLLKTDKTPLDEVERKEEYNRVVNSLLKLPEQQKNAIVYNYYYSMSHKQISEKINRPIGSVKSMIRYGIKNLRKFYIESSSVEKRGDSDEN